MYNNQFAPGFTNDLTTFATSNNMSLKELAQYMNMMSYRQTILEQHKSPISQNEKDKRWRTRLPNGKQLVKTRLADLEDAIIEYYANLSTKQEDSNAHTTEPSTTEIRTLKTIYPKWKELREYEVSTNTHSIHERMWKYYVENSEIANIPLSQLDKEELAKWAYALIEKHKMKQKYFSNLRTLINLLLDYAITKKYIKEHPFRGIKFNKKKFHENNLKEDYEEVFTVREQELVMKEAELDSRQSHSAIPLGICILFLTGLRIGELCGLKYGDIKGNYLHISRMLVEKKKKTSNGIKCDGYEIVERTKSKAGNRYIYLTPEARAYFEQIKELNQKNGYSTSNKDFIFQRKEGLCNQRVFYSRLKKYANHLNFPFVKSCHDIRRTYISYLFDLGIPPEKIQKIAGHEHIEMTMKYLRNRMEEDDIERILDKGLPKTKGV